MPVPYQKPELDAALTSLRTAATAWKTNVERTQSSERDGKGFAWDIERLEERDDLASHFITTFNQLDQVMATHHGARTCAPAAWRGPQFTDYVFTTFLRQMPELDVFEPESTRELASHFGIRYVRYLAQNTMKRAREILAREATPVPTQPVPLESDTLRAALLALGFSVYDDEEGGFTWLVVPLAKGTPEDDMYAGLHFRIAAGERADRPAAEHSEPWTVHLYDEDGNYMELLDLTPPVGLSLVEESALCARAIAAYAAQS